jgi:lipoprotein NlpD
MGMTKIRLISIGTMIALLTACSVTPRRPAPVFDRAPAEGQSAGVAPSAQPLESGYYMVKRGDTLYRIALEFGQSSRDIVAWNNLSSANDIKVNQILRVLPPGTTSRTAGVQVGSVASSSSVEVRPLNTAPSSTGPASHSGAEVANKSGPLGDKKPYSEAALAEMQKPEALTAPGTPAKTEAPKTAENSANAAESASDEEGVAWIWPTEGKIVGNFSGGKKGIDIAGKLGQQIVAAGAGKVMYAGSGIRGYGNLVIIKHTNNLLSAYAHNKTILVKEGQTITKGQKIAEMGNSDADAVKLHFEIRRQGKPVDPAKFLPRR